MGISLFHYTMIISDFSKIGFIYGFQRYLILNLVVTRVYGISHSARNNSWLASRMRLQGELICKLTNATQQGQDMIS